MRALVEAAAAPDYPASIVGVLSNRANAPGLAFARDHGIATAVRSHRDYADRDSFDAALDAALTGWRAEIVCLAGFMRILSPGFVARWQGRLLNIHPSLLPQFRGLHTHERALAAGAGMHGCTVHFVTEGLDEGPTILQAQVPVLSGDTPDSLGTRVLEAEHRIYPEALALVARGQVTLVPTGHQSR
jgi:formyltetrahydrofolate-dependent phosphoribosylglycinamide formyltransferase